MSEATTSEESVDFPSNYDQEIFIEPGHDGSSYSLTGRNIHVYSCGSYNVRRDSSKVKSSSILEFRWEQKHYRGRVVITHRDGDFVAYNLLANDSTLLRIYSRKYQSRSLIKGFTGKIMDMEFSHSRHAPYLACVDQAGNIWIYVIIDDGEKINVKKLLQINREIPDLIDVDNDPWKINWCAYIPDEDTSRAIVRPARDSYSLLCVSHGDTMEVYYINLVLKAIGHRDQIAYEELKNMDMAMKEIHVNKDCTIDAVAIAPNVEAIGAATSEGEMLFYQFGADENKRGSDGWNFDLCKFRKTLHQHRKQTNAILFLDDISSDDPEIEEPPARDDDSKPMPPQCAIDPTGQIIMISFLDRSCIVVIEMNEEDLGDGKRSCLMRSYTEIPLAQPVLSMSIVEAGHCRFRTFSAEEQQHDDEEEEENEAAKVSGIRCVLYAVKPRSLIEMDIRFRPDYYLVNGNGGGDESCKSISTNDDYGKFRDELSDVGSHFLKMKNGGESPQKALLTPTDLLCNEVSRDFEKSSEESGSSSRSPTPVIRKKHGRESVSPTSVEVKKILSHHVNEEETEIYSDSEERPGTPVADELEQEASDFSNNGDGENGSFPPPPEATTTNTEQVRVLCTMVEGLQSTVDSLRSCVENLEQQVRTKTVDDRQKDEILMKLASSIQSLQISNVSAPTVASLGNQEQLTAAVSQEVLRQLETSLQKELYQQIGVYVSQSMRQLHDQMNNETNRRLVGIEQTVKTQVGQMIRSNQLIEAYSKGLTHALVPALNETFRGSVSETVPQWDRSCANIFTQLNETFQKGLSEFMKQIRSQSDAVMRDQKEFRSRMDQLTVDVSQKLQADLNSGLTHVEAAVHSQFTGMIAKFQEFLNVSLRSIIRSEIEATLKDVGNHHGSPGFLRSAAATPVPTIAEKQQELQHMIKQEHYNIAFNEALCANDISLVTWLCNKVPSKQLFSRKPFPLETNVLLSLVHQISADLGKHTETKMSYLERAVPHIDREDPRVKQHIPQIVKQLNQRLKAFESNCPPEWEHVLKTLLVYCEMLNR